MSDKFSDWTDENIVSKIIEMQIRQKDFRENENIKIYTKNFKLISKLEEELRKRNGNKRTLLFPFLNHDNIQVRLGVALELLAVAPVPARQTLEAIVQSKWMPFALDAGMALSMLDSGSFKPK